MYMADEFPAQEPKESIELKCMPAHRIQYEPSIDLSGQDEVLVFGEDCQNHEDENGKLTLPEAWVKTQQEMRADFKRKLSEKSNEQDQDESARKKKRLKRSGRHVTHQREQKARRKLTRQKKREDMQAFKAEFSLRRNLGYSHEQLLQSQVADIGKVVKVTDAEVKKYLKDKASVSTPQKHRN